MTIPDAIGLVLVAIGLLVSAFTCVFTLIYVLITNALLSETRKSRDPSVVVDIEIPDGSLRLCVSNVGLSAARNVKLTVHHDIPWIGENQGKKFDSIRAISKGLSFLPAGRTFKYRLPAINWKELAERSEVPVEIRADYQNEAGCQLHSEYVLDVAQYQSVLFESFQLPEAVAAHAIHEEERQNQSFSEMKNRVVARFSERACPWCSSPISKAAKKCPQCHEWIDRQPDTLAANDKTDQKGDNAA
jgi:hypothetical protein